MLPYVAISFSFSGFHAAGGPITASRPKYTLLKKEALMEAITDEGYEFVDSNAFEQIGKKSN